MFMDHSQASEMPSIKIAEAAADGPQRVQSEALLGKAGELLIVHNGREYRLRMTQNGKLILTA
jgi:hemin uptake protein HemP